MRHVLAVACLAVGVCASFGTVAADPPDTSATPWQLAWNAEWVKPQLVREGFVPLTYGANRYYCRLDASPKLASLLNSRIYCGDADSLWMTYRLDRFPAELLH